MSDLDSEIRRRLQRLFRLLHSGGDAPPGLRLRTEGLMEAAVLTGDAQPGELQALMTHIYSEVYGRGLDEALGADWRELFPFPQIPALAQRAPVYPSTRD